MDKNDDKKYERTGKAVFGIAYFLFALKYTAVFSLVALAILWFCGKPLWLSPVFGIAAFLIYRFFRRLILTLIIRFARWADK